MKIQHIYNSNLWGRKEGKQTNTKILIKENFPEIKQLEKDLKLHIERAQYFSENIDKNIYWLSK